MRVLLLALVLALPSSADDLSEALQKALRLAANPPQPAKAEQLYNDKDYEKAAVEYLAHLESQPSDAGSWYNLACCLALCDRADDALAALKEAVQKGFTDVEHMKTDTDLAPIRKTQGFKDLVKGLGGDSGAKARVEWVAGESIWPVSIRKPKGYDSKKQYGLLLILHGRGDTAENFLKQVEAWRGDDFYVAALETPYLMPLPGGRLGHCWSPWESGNENIEAAYKLSAATVGKTIADLKAKLHVDAKRVYLLGFSEGAFLTAHSAMRFADDLAGAVVIGGGFQPTLVDDEDFARARKIRILVAHGTSDGTVPYGSGEKLFDTLKSRGATPEMFPFEGGHELTEDLRKGVDGWIRGKEIPAELKAKAPK